VVSIRYEVALADEQASMRISKARGIVLIIGNQPVSTSLPGWSPGECTPTASWIRDIRAMKNDAERETAGRHVRYALAVSDSHGVECEEVGSPGRTRTCDQSV